MLLQPRCHLKLRCLSSVQHRLVLLRTLETEHWVSLALAEAGLAHVVDQGQMQLPHHTVHLLKRV